MSARSDDDGVLRVHLEGPAVRNNRMALVDVADFARHLQNAAFRVAAVLLGQQSSRRGGPVPGEIARLCTLELVAVEDGSFGLCADLRRDEDVLPLGAPHPGEPVLASLLGGLEQAADPAAPLPHGYDIGVLCSWRDAAKILDRGVDHVTFSLRTRGAQQTSLFDAHLNRGIAARLQAPLRNQRTVEGRLLMGDFKETGYACRVYPAVGPAVFCTFDEAHRNTVLNALTKKVRVVGEATQTDGRITALRIADVQELGDEALVLPLDESRMDFEEVPDIREAAMRQGVRPADTFDALLGDFWPEDESVDDFVATVHAWRHEEEGGDQTP